MKRLIQFIFISVIFAACSNKEAITESDVKHLLKTWEEAFYNKDSSLLSEALHKDYIYSGNSDGSTTSKIQYMLNLANSDFDIVQIDLNDVTINYYDHIAIVRGSEIITLKLSSGDTVAAKLRFTDTYIKENELVQALSTHSSPIE